MIKINVSIKMILLYVDWGRKDEGRGEDTRNFSGKNESWESSY